MFDGNEQIEKMPVIKGLKDFNKKSGNWLERLVFNHRVTFILFCTVFTLLLSYQAIHINLSASFEKMIPNNHPYIKNYIENKGELAGLGNVVRIAVENTEGTIYDPGYLEFLKQISDEIMLTPGTDRAWIKSLWMAGVRWTSVTEEGFTGGTVMPQDYDGSPESLAELKLNIIKANLIGSLVGLDSKSSMIIVPLMDQDPNTGKPLDYNEFAKALENLRNRETDQYKIHIIGFAKLVGDLIDGLSKMMLFFIAAFLITAVIIYLYTRCIRSTFTLLFCSLIAVVWLLGLLVTLGYDLDPYSVLVPFLVFAIGVSHGSQKMNGILQDIGRGTHRLIAARYTFRRLFIAGLNALLADTVGFAVLMLIDIPVIQDLALTASLGVAILIFTNLLLLPVMLSFVGVSQKSAIASLKEESDPSSFTARASRILSKATQRKQAIAIIIISIFIACIGLVARSNIKIGDLDPGVPDLRADSRYNKDNDYITSHYSLSSDVFAVMVKTPVRQGTAYETIIEMDRLEWALQQLPGVQATMSIAGAIKGFTAGTGDGNPKWYTLSRNQRALNYGSTWVLQNMPEYANTDVSIVPVIVYLKDHRAEDT